MVGKSLKIVLGAFLVSFLLVMSISTPVGKVRFIPLASAESLASLVLDLDRQEIDLGESVNMTITITANADIDFQTRLLVFINGEVQYDASLSPLTAGTVLEYQFQYTPSTAGYYTIQAMLIKDTSI